MATFDIKQKLTGVVIRLAASVKEDQDAVTSYKTTLAFDYSNLTVEQALIRAAGGDRILWQASKRRKWSQTVMENLPKEVRIVVTPPGERQAQTMDIESMSDAQIAEVLRRIQLRDKRKAESEEDDLETGVENTLDDKDDK